jgi:hypothetical protein
MGVYAPVADPGLMYSLPSSSNAANSCVWPAQGGCMYGYVADDIIQYVHIQQRRFHTIRIHTAAIWLKNPIQYRTLRTMFSDSKEPVLGLVGFRLERIMQYGYVSRHLTGHQNERSNSNNTVDALNMCIVSLILSRYRDHSK